MYNDTSNQFTTASWIEPEKSAAFLYAQLFQVQSNTPRD